jgi:ADP-ribose pyrophosphatase
VKRELEEETGYRAEKWTDLGFVYTSPGYSDEKLYLYKAENLSFTKCNPDEGEILQPLEISKNDAFEMINNGKINDAKTLCAFFRGFKND